MHLQGEYYTEWRALGPCPPEKRGTDEIHTDVRITKRNRKAEITGKCDYKIDFDDTISVRIKIQK